VTEPARKPEIHPAVERARHVLRHESRALDAIASRLGSEFAAAVDVLKQSSGRVIVTGVGKSGLIGRKIAATFTSTGTPATFLHPIDSVHGDLGIVGADDVAIIISKSGESDELISLLQHLKRFGVRTIAIVGAPRSTLGRHCDVTLDAGVDEEACPLDLAPTTSTTAALALGDALAVVLLEEKGFRAEDFARLHPGGSLGRRLLLRVSDLMLTEDIPVISPDARVREAIILIAERRGIAIAVDGAGKLVGVMTAGDLTRMMEKVDDVLSMSVRALITLTPKVTHPEELASAAVYRMQQHGKMSMPVVDAENTVVGVVHLHDLMRAGAG
jgi:arabinose-5-phosphate isomerase